MNRRMILYTIGQMIWIEAMLLLCPAIISLIYRESAIWAFLITIGIALIVGLALVLLSKPKDYVIYAKEGFVIVGLAWIIMSAVGALPFVISGDIPSYVDAFFETASGFTTTGASILDDVEVLSRGANFWRCFTHWLGGMGVLVFVMAVIPNLSDRSIHIMRAEMPGPIVGKIVPRVKDTAKILYLIYIGITALEFVFLLFGGMTAYEAIVHAFGTAGTGGFGIRNDSITSFSPYIQWVITAFMLLFGINFNLYYMILIRRAKAAFSSAELWVYLGIVVSASVAIGINIFPLIGNLTDTVRTSVFQVSSIITTTGYSTASFNDWPQLSKSILLILMFMGGCAGSTAGGFKLSRVLILVKTLKREIKRMLHPRSVSMVRLEGKPLEDETVTSVLVYLIAYIFGLFIVTFLLCFEPFDFETNFTAAVSCFNNVGPFFSHTVSTASMSLFSPFSKIVLSLAMLFGRLEIFPLLIALSPSLRSKK